MRRNLQDEDYEKTFANGYEKTLCIHFVFMMQSICYSLSVVFIIPQIGFTKLGVLTV